MADGGDGDLDGLKAAADAAAGAARGADANADRPCGVSDAWSGADASADAYANADAYASDPNDDRRPVHRHSPWHCWPAFRRTVRSYWPATPADGSAGDSGAGAHGTGTADASAAAPTPGCASVLAERFPRSAAFRQTVAAGCTPVLRLRLLLPFRFRVRDSGSTVKWRDSRRAASGPSAGAAGRVPADSHTQT